MPDYIFKPVEFYGTTGGTNRTLVTLDTGGRIQASLSSEATIHVDVVGVGATTSTFTKVDTSSTTGPILMDSGSRLILSASSTVLSSPTGTQQTDIRQWGGTNQAGFNFITRMTSTLMPITGGTLTAIISQWGGQAQTSLDFITRMTGTLMNTTGGTVSTIPTGTQDSNLVSVRGSIDTTSADAVATATYVPISSFLRGFNATNWDRIRTTGAISGGTLTTGLLATGITERNYFVTTIFSGTTGIANSTFTSAALDVSRYTTKTVSINSTSAGTLFIDAAPVSSGTLYVYNTDNNIAANTFTTKTFTEAFNQTRVRFLSPTATSTIDSYLGVQA